MGVSRSGASLIPVSRNLMESLSEVFVGSSSARKRNGCWSIQLTYSVGWSSLVSYFSVYFLNFFLEMLIGGMDIDFGLNYVHFGYSLIQLFAK